MLLLLVQLIAGEFLKTRLVQLCRKVIHRKCNSLLPSSIIYAWAGQIFQIEASRALKSL